MPHIVMTADGSTFDLKKVAAIADQLEQDFLSAPEIYEPFIGAEVITDPSDPTKRYMLPLETASWLFNKTHVGISAPWALVASGACKSSPVAMPALYDLMSGKMAFVAGVAKLHGVEPATYPVLAGILVAYLDKFGYNFVVGVVQECHYGEERERDLDSLNEVVEFVLDNWMSSTAGTFLPTDGLTVDEVNDIISAYMADCDDAYAHVDNFLEGFEH